jgi:hypothetical protein
MLRITSAAIVLVSFVLMSCVEDPSKTPDEVFSEYLDVIGKAGSARDTQVNSLLSLRAAQYKTEELNEMFKKVPPDQVGMYEQMALKMLQAPIHRPKEYETRRSYEEQTATLSFHYGIIKENKSQSIIEKIIFVQENGWKIDKITKTTKSQSRDGKSSSETTEEHF